MKMLKHPFAELQACVVLLSLILGGLSLDVHAQGSSDDSDTDSTQQSSAKKGSPETIALSYLALSELVKKIKEAFGPTLSRYSGVAVYNEGEFSNLLGYRMFRDEITQFLAEYKSIESDVKRAPELVAKAEMAAVSGPGVSTSGFVSDIAEATGAVASGTAFAGAVGGFLKVIRNQTTIESTAVSIDEASVGAMLGSELSKNGSGLRMFYPWVFSPEYQVDIKGEDSVIQMVKSISEAKAVTADALRVWNASSEGARNVKAYKERFTKIEVLDTKMATILAALGLGEASGKNESRDRGAELLRTLIRAEKLDRFLTGRSAGVGAGASNVGIVKFRVISSGGSRKETRNLLLGNRITFSGMAVVEVMVFDVDGTLRDSRIFTHHTGFRKIQRGVSDF